MSCKHIPIPVGTVYGRLTVLDAPTIRSNVGDVMYLCECTCKSEPRHYYNGKLRRGTTQSCGCFRKDELKKRRKLPTKPNKE